MEEITNQTLHEILIRVEKKVDKQNGRLGKLELWRSGLVGGWIMLCVVIPLVVLYLK